MTEEPVRRPGVSKYSVPPTLADEHTDHERDRAAIESLIADIKHGFNTKDANPLVAPFAADGTAVNVQGMQLVGRQPMVDVSKELLGGRCRTSGPVTGLRT